MLQHVASKFLMKMITGAGVIRENAKGRVSNVLFAETAVKFFKRVGK